MENKSKTWIIVLIVVVILMLPILVDFIGNSKVKEITYDKYLDIKENGENALIYVGDLSQDSYDDTVDVLKEVMDDATSTDYSSEYSVYSIDSTELTNDESANIGTASGYVFMINGDKQKVLTTTATTDYLIDLVDDYLKRVNKYHKVELIELKDSNIKTEALEIEKYESLDIIASSFEEGTTVSPVDPTINNDPYENDKW